MNYEEVARLKTTFTSDTNPLRRGFRIADGYIKSFTAKWAGGINVKVGLELGELQSDADQANAILAPLRASSVRIKTNLTGIKRLLGELAGAKAAADSLDGDTVTIPVDTRGIVRAGAQLFALQKTVDIFHHRTRRPFRFSADIDRSLSQLLPKALGDSLHVLAQLETVGAAVHAIMVPSLIAAFGAAATVVTGFAGHVAALAFELGKGLGGAFGVLAGAAGLGSAALIGFGFAVQKTLNYAFDLTGMLGSTSANIGQLSKYIIPELTAQLKKAQVGTEEYTSAQRALNIANMELAFQQQRLVALGAIATDNIMRLQSASHVAQLRMIDFGGAIANRVAPAITHMIWEGLDLFPRYRDTVVNTFGQMADAALLFFSNVLTKGQQLKSFNTIFAGIAASGVPALRAVANAAAALMNVIAVIVPDSVRMVKTIQDLAVAARQWTASAAGQNRISQIWQGMMQRAGQLWRIVRDLSIGLWGVAKALSATAGGPAIRGMQEMARSFRQLMVDGGRGQAAIRKFMTDVRPILAAAAGVVGTLVKEFFRVIGAIAGMKSAATGINPLVGLLHDVQAAIRPIGNLIITNFAALAPRLGPLILNVAKIASVFLQAILPLRVFIDILNRVLTWFTSLDPALQRAIAGFFSWLYVINKVTGGGIGKLIGLIGPLAAGLISLTGPFGAIAIAIGAVVAAGVLLYKNWGNLDKLFGKGLGPALEKIKQAVTNAGKSIIQWAKNTWPKVKQFAVSAISAIIAKAKQIWNQVQPGVKAFQQGIKTIQTALQGAGGKTNQFKGFISTLGNILRVVGGVLQKLFVGAVNLLGKAMKAIAPIIANYIKGFKAMAPILKPLGALIKGLLVGAFKALWPVIKLVATVVAGALLIALKGASAAFVKFGQFIGWVGKKLKPFSPLIEKIGKVVGYVFATVIVGAIGKALQIGAKIITWGAKLLPGAFGKAVGAVKGLVSFFQKLLSGAKAVFDGLGKAASSAVQYIIGKWKGLQSGIQSVWNAVKSKLGGFAETIKNVLGNINLFQIGKDIIAGLINGIVDSIPGLRTVFNKVADAMPNWLKRRLDIKSPSGVAEREVGMPFGAGIGVGLDKSIAQVIRTMRYRTDALQAAMRQGLIGSDTYFRARNTIFTTGMQKINNLRQLNAPAYLPTARAAGSHSDIIGSSAPINVTVNINGANTSDPRGTAQEFKREFEWALDDLSRNRK